MKYTVGQQLFYKRFNDKYISCKVIKVLENSKRYRIEHRPWGDRLKQSIMDEAKLFPSISEAIDFEINEIMSKISTLQAEMVKLQEIKKVVN